MVPPIEVAEKYQSYHLSSISNVRFTAEILLGRLPALGRPETTRPTSAFSHSLSEANQSGRGMSRRSSVSVTVRVSDRPSGPLISSFVTFVRRRTFPSVSVRPQNRQGLPLSVARLGRLTTATSRALPSRPRQVSVSSCRCSPRWDRVILCAGDGSRTRAFEQWFCASKGIHFRISSRINSLPRCFL